MNVDKFPKELGRIDLSRFEKAKRPGSEPRLEEYLPLVKERLRELAASNNQKLPGFLESDACIAMIGPEAESDAVLVQEQERGFALSSGKNLEDWQRSTEKNPANLTEMALTLLLHKELGDDFIVARASKYDDYNHGVDQVIIHIPSGEIVCGFDAVIGHQGDDGGAKKEGKIARMLAKGGARLKYGAKLEDGRLVRAAAKNLPVFYLAISKEELGALLKSISQAPRASQPIEDQIFEKFLNSLEEQSAKTKESGLINGELSQKMESVRQKLSASRRQAA